MRDRKWKWVFVDDVLATGLHLASMKKYGPCWWVDKKQNAV